VSQAAFSIENAKNYQKIFQEKKKLETTIRGMADGVVVTDSNHIVVLSNETANTILQTSKPEIIGKNIFSLMQDFVLSMPPEDITISKTRTVHYEVTSSGPDYKVYSVKETKIMEGANRIVNIIMVFRDITERKKQDVLKTEFLSLISHKLRTPLVGVIGYPQFLLDGSMGELNEMQRQAIKSIEDQGNYLNDLVGQLLKFAELESKSLSIAKEPYELYVLAGGIIEFMRKTADENNIEIVVDVPKNLPPVFINPERIGEVLINLVDNAIKFSEADASKKVWIKAFQKNDDFIQISVIDEGVGIKEKNIDKIFDRFYQSEEYFTGQVKGAGLGLAMVKHLVEHHGGTIWVESHEGVGSKFHFTLPIVLEETVSNEKNLYL
jgi:two-component system phosphate regulon sensor histidine kinase PhoR